MMKLPILMAGVLLMGCDGPAVANDATTSQATAPTSLNTYESVTMTDFVALQKTGIQLVDVRTPAEFAAGHVPGAINIPLDAFEPTHPLMHTLSKDKPVYMVCASGARSGVASQKMAAAGRTVFNVEGGTMAWTAAGHAVDFAQTNR